MNTNENNPLLLAGSVIVAGLLIAGAVMWNGSRPPSAPQAQQGSTATVKDVNIKGLPFIGEEDAPLTLVFWSDFQCPFCKAFEIGHPQIPTPPAFPDIVKNYVETGKVKVVFKDVVFLSPRMGTDSLTGVLYSQSVWKLYPTKYHEWRTTYFENQDEEGAGFGSATSIDEMNATIAGIDAQKVAADVKANTSAYTAQAQANTADAQKLRITATPSVIVGTQVIAGAYPYANFEAAIEQELAK
jgi:protein-disulfide isomerase